MVDQEDIPLRQRWVVWGLFWALWTLVGLFDAGQMYLLCRVVDRPIPADLIVCLFLTQWYLFGLLTPLLVELHRWTTARAFSWTIALPLQGAGMILFALVEVFLDVPVHRAMRSGWQSDWTPLEWFQILLPARFIPYLLVSAVILGVCHARAYYRQYRERELRTSQLQVQLAQAQLQVLKMQLHPHFLFNTLHTIAALMRVDVDLAERMVARLGDLLRSSLENAGRQEVSLRQELEFIKPYLEIEQARLGQRLRVRLEVPSDVQGACVPNLILQPLIENAIRHGIAARAEGGTIAVRAWRAGDRLHLEVADDGPGLAETRPARIGQGIGLTNTRARLAQLYGGDQQFELRNTPGQGLVVALTLPLREESEEELLPTPDVAPISLGGPIVTA